MKQKIINEALNNILQKRSQAEYKSKEMLLSALKNPEFKQTYDAYKSEIIARAKSEAYGENYDNEKFKTAENKYNSMKNLLNLQDLEPNYLCKKCSDTGLVNGEYCSCLKQEITKILMKSSGFKELKDFKNSDFNIFENQEQIKKIYDLLKKWCNVDTEKTLVFIFGQTGTGKSYAMQCVANEMIKQGKLVQILTAFSLNQKFLAIHTSPEEEKTSLINELMEIEVLLIDDLGTEPLYRNVTKEYLYLLINERQIRGLKTLITSNLTPEQIHERYDERIFSRMVNKDKSIAIEMNGKDLRIKK